MRAKPVTVSSTVQLQLFVFGYGTPGRLPCVFVLGAFWERTRDGFER